jgi:hypothetical protein
VSIAPLLPALLLFVCTLDLQYATTPDSLNYLQAASGLRSAGRFDAGFTYWPPLYPALLALHPGDIGTWAALLGRKIMQLQGVGMRHFLAQIQAFCMAHSTREDMIEFILPLAEVAKQWGELTMHVGKKAAANPDEIGAASVDYLFYSGYVALAYWWAQSVAVAEGSPHPEALRRAKRETARFYFARILPRINAHAAAVKAGAGTLASLAESEF